MPPRFDKFTVKAQDALQRAQALAQQHNQQQMDPLHLLAALLAEEQGAVKPLLEKAGANVRQIERIAQSELARLPKVSGASGDVYLSREANAVLEAAQQEADRLKDEYVSTEHLLLALTKADSKAK